MEFCCICANTLSAGALSSERRLHCCGRIVCGFCSKENPRFATYCPYCQVSSIPSPLPQGLKDPPSYTAVSSSMRRTTETSCAPPPYSPTDDMSTAATASEVGSVSDEKAVAEDTLHFLDHDRDSITSLSFRYGVPPAALRHANHIASDHLLLGRKTISIPGKYYKSGVSLSPRPVLGEEDEMRKAQIRRFMTTCKVFDYDVAVLYLEQSGYCLDDAVEAYSGDETWGKEHALDRACDRAPTGWNKGPFWRGLSQRP